MLTINSGFILTRYMAVLFLMLVMAEQKGRTFCRRLWTFSGCTCSISAHTTWRFGTVDLWGQNIAGSRFRTPVGLGLWVQRPQKPHIGLNTQSADDKRIIQH